MANILELQHEKDDHQFTSEIASQAMLYPFENIHYYVPGLTGLMYGVLNNNKELVKRLFKHEFEINLPHDIYVPMERRPLETAVAYINGRARSIYSEMKASFIGCIP